MLSCLPFVYRSPSITSNFNYNESTNYYYNNNNNNRSTLVHYPNRMANIRRPINSRHSAVSVSKCNGHHSHVSSASTRSMTNKSPRPKEVAALRRTSDDVAVRRSLAVAIGLVPLNGNARPPQKLSMVRSECGDWRLRNELIEMNKIGDSKNDDDDADVEMANKRRTQRRSSSLLSALRKL